MTKITTTPVDTRKFILVHLIEVKKFLLPILIILPLLIWGSFRAGAQTDQEEVMNCMLQKAEGNPAAMRSCMDQFFPGLTACLFEAVGAERFNAISSGASQPTAEEMKNGEACFTKLGFKPPQVTASPHQPVDIQVEACLKQKLGNARIEQLKAAGGGGITFEEQQKAQPCFGDAPGAPSPIPMEPSKQMSLDSATTACLKAAVGEDRFTQISAGGSTPTEAEMQAGQSCFGTKPIGAITPDDVLVPAAEAVPYLPEDDQAVMIEEITPDETGEGVTVEGAAPPEGTVDVHIYSDPVSIRTQAGTDGKFSLHLEKSLESGAHLAYATTKSAGQTVRSPEKAFAVGDLAEQAKTALSENLSSWLPALGGGVVLLVVAALLLLWHSRLKLPSKG